MRICGLVSLSGGQGKTTTSFLLGLHLARCGLKVLWIDADPQGNLSFFSGVQVGSSEPALDHVYRGDGQIGDSIYRVVWENLYIIPGTERLARVNEYLASSGNGGRMLERRLRPIQNYFDYCIIDAPPSRSQIVLSVIGACTDIIIPFEVAIKGTNCLIETLNLLSDLSELEIWRGNLVGVLPFRDKWYGMSQMIDARENMDAVRLYLGNQVQIFPAIIESAQYRTAIRQGKTLTDIGHSKLDLPFITILEKLGVQSYAKT